MMKSAIATVLLFALTVGAILLPGVASADQGVRIYGFVFDRTGQPVANATVTLFLDNVPLHTGSNPAITDLQGYFEFPGIQHGVYCLVAEKNNFPYSTTIRLQTWDQLVNFTLQGSTADLADIRATMATPLATAVPETATATPPAVTTPGPSASPGFAAVIALAGIFFTGLVKRRKQ